MQEYISRWNIMFVGCVTCIRLKINSIYPTYPNWETFAVAKQPLLQMLCHRTPLICISINFIWYRFQYRIAWISPPIALLLCSHARFNVLFFNFNSFPTGQNDRHSDRRHFQMHFLEYWNLFTWVQLTISLHWFRWWLGAEQATSHYLNQWWPSSLTRMCDTKGRWVKCFMASRWRYKSDVSEITFDLLLI